jgi:hypothetical protein
MRNSAATSSFRRASRNEEAGGGVTRKHFKAIATTLNNAQNHFSSDNDYAQFCLEMAYTLRVFNKNFNIDKFLAACHAKLTPVGQKELF